MEEGLTSIRIVPWPTQERLLLALSVKPYPNTSHNPTLFTATAEKGKKIPSRLLRGHWGMAETPMPANAGTPMERGQSGKYITRAMQHQMLSCSSS